MPQDILYELDQQIDRRVEISAHFAVSLVNVIEKYNEWALYGSRLRLSKMFANVDETRFIYKSVETSLQ